MPLNLVLRRAVANCLPCLYKGGGKILPMRVVIYSTSSFGGCFDYALQLHEAYNSNLEVERVVSYFPQNAQIPSRTDMQAILMPDRLHHNATARQKQLHFLQRSARNPLRLLRRLQHAPPSLVIFNDWEQITAPMWVPMFQAGIGNRHKFACILHDPDRDHYPPNLKTSTACMRTMMRLMHLGLYHDFLPEKPYYAKNNRTQYLDVPHGLYPAADADLPMQHNLKQHLDPKLKWMTILGNIRPEKNYELAIEALQNFPGLGLLIAGQPSHQGVDLDAYRKLASELGVSDRIFWLEKYLTDAEMSAVIAHADFLLLYYASSFSSQSGVLNTAAPFRKTIIASDGESSLAATLRRFSIGVLAPPDNLEELCKAIARVLEGYGPDLADWGNYLEYASWENHAAKVIRAAKELGLE